MTLRGGIPFHVNSVVIKYQGLSMVVKPQTKVIDSHFTSGIVW